MRRLYFDYAATTPTDSRVLEAMRSYWSAKFGNPSSLHSFGQETQAAVDEAREKIAGLLGAGFREIIFTGSATEANNLALRGVVRAAKIRSPRIIVSAVEHESVLETARDLEKDGVEVVYLPVDKSGKVMLNKLRQALNERTVLVSVMYANNELGAIQPIREIAKIVTEFRSEQRDGRYPLLHTDAVQAFQYLDCGVNKLGLDLMTLSGHKIYGPKGVGVLYVRERTSLAPVITGGGQEFGLRSGTENVPLIVGMAEAAELAARVRVKEAKRIAGLRGYFLRGLKKIYPKVEVNAPRNAIFTSSQDVNMAGLPSMLNLFFPDYPADELVTRLDLLGIAIGTGSACASRAPEASRVLRAAGFSEARAKRSVRFSFGRRTTQAEVDIFMGRVKKLLI